MSALIRGAVKSVQHVDAVITSGNYQVVANFAAVNTNKTTFSLRSGTYPESAAALYADCQVIIASITSTSVTIQRFTNSAFNLRCYLEIIEYY